MQFATLLFKCSIQRGTKWYWFTICEFNGVRSYVPNKTRRKSRNLGRALGRAPERRMRGVVKFGAVVGVALLYDVDGLATQILS